MVYRSWNSTDFDVLSAVLAVVDTSAFKLIFVDVYVCIHYSSYCSY